ncbi:MAG: hypothetical protein AAGI38_05340 [Bacteroidota bacterium]
MLELFDKSDFGNKLLLVKRFSLEKVGDGFSPTSVGFIQLSIGHDGSLCSNGLYHQGRIVRRKV